MHVGMLGSSLSHRMPAGRAKRSSQLSGLSCVLDCRVYTSGPSAAAHVVGELAAVVARLAAVVARRGSSARREGRIGIFKFVFLRSSCGGCVLVHF